MAYPYAHYDEDDTCQCPDHVAMREVRRAEDEANAPYGTRLLQAILRRFG